jgi:hypothetical protein
MVDTQVVKIERSKENGGYSLTVKRNKKAENASVGMMRVSSSSSSFHFILFFLTLIAYSFSAHGRCPWRASGPSLSRCLLLAEVCCNCFTLFRGMLL